MAVSTMAPGSFYFDMYCDLYDQNALLEKAVSQSYVFESYFQS